jgi:hypothetical protein
MSRIEMWECIKNDLDYFSGDEIECGKDEFILFGDCGECEGW